jgi:hypothetical protein
MDQSTNGSVFVNNGDFNFSLIIPPEAYKLYASLGQNGIIKSLTETSRRMNELKKKNEEEKAKRLAKDRENKKNNFKYSSRNFKSQLKLLQTQGNLAVCKAILKEFYAGDYYSQTNKETYLFISIDSNGLDCHYEWSRNESNALRRCKQNTKFDGECTIYALGDNIVWGNPKLYKELTGRK